MFSSLTFSMGKLWPCSMSVNSVNPLLKVRLALNKLGVSSSLVLVGTRDARSKSRIATTLLPRITTHNLPVPVCRFFSFLKKEDKLSHPQHLIHYALRLRLRLVPAQRIFSWQGRNVKWLKQWLEEIIVPQSIHCMGNCFNIQVRRFCIVLQQNIGIVDTRNDILYMSCSEIKKSF